MHQEIHMQHWYDTYENYQNFYIKNDAEKWVYETYDLFICRQGSWEWSEYDLLSRRQLNHKYDQYIGWLHIHERHKITETKTYV